MFSLDGPASLITQSFMITVSAGGLEDKGKRLLCVTDSPLFPSIKNPFNLTPLTFHADNSNIDL